MKSIWQHPDFPDIEVPRKTAAILVLFEMGIDDLQQIASATGATLKQVEEVEQARETAVRRLAAVRLPAGHFFSLRGSVQCPECLERISTVPCVSCSVRRETRQRGASAISESA